jgi:SAM-dependent methyltransferase
VADAQRSLVPPPRNVRPPQVRAARYSGGAKPTEAWAHFESGVTVPITVGRVRAYPSLSGCAPSTLPFYRAFASTLNAESRVIDAGCGAGTGSAILKTTAGHVLGVDCDPRALAFAREYAPGVEFVQSDFGAALPGQTGTHAVMADVLGHLLDPEIFLASMRESLDPGAKILVAEPTAFVAQRLAVPVRRAFSLRSLEALLTRGGFRATAWVADTGTFIGCLATVEDSPGSEHFAAAARCRESSPETALAALALAAHGSGRDVRREAALAEAGLRIALGQGDAAVGAYIAAAELDPTDARPVAGLALLALGSGALDDAMELATRAAELDPTEPTASLALAQAMDHLSPRDAFHAYRIAERLAPTNLGVASRLAALAADRGDYAFGISVFERLRAYGDRLPIDFYVTLALLHLAEGRRADAILELRLARTLDPAHPAVCELWSELQDAAS